MIPPLWITESGKRLSMPEFGQAFSSAWSNMENRFLKLECWQDYTEQEDNKSQEAFKAGNIGLARKLLTEEAEGDRPLYEDVNARNLDYARIRLLKPPLSSYLRYESMSYSIRAAMGENILAVVLGPEVQLPSEDYFDFLLFDQSVALVHDYGTDGFQVGGWLIDDQETLTRLEGIAANLQAQAKPLLEVLQDIDL